MHKLKRDWLWRSICTEWGCAIAKSCLILCNPVDCSTPGFPTLHCLLELAQTHAHCIHVAIRMG